MSLLVRPQTPDAKGVVTDVTPASAGWTYVGFRVVKLAAGQSYNGAEDGREACLVILSGKVSVEAGGEFHADLGGRRDVFDGPATSVYLPADLPYSITAETDA